MKKISRILLIIMTASIFITSCREEKSAGDKVEDAVEDVADDVEDAVD